MVSPVRQIRYRNRDIELPRSGVRPDARLARYLLT
jgi:hypothetical protein